MERLRRDDAAALVRPTPKRYKNFRTRKKLVRIKQTLKDTQETHANQQVRPPNEDALALCLVPTTQPGENGSGWVAGQSASLALENLKDLQRVKERRTKGVAEKVPMAIMSETERSSYSSFEAWVGRKGQECPPAMLQVSCKYWDIFMDK